MCNHARKLKIDNDWGQSVKTSPPSPLHES